MPGSEEVQKFYQPKFTTEMALLSQQMVPKLRPWMTVGEYKGESAEAVKQIGVIEANVDDEDGDGDTPNNEAPRDQRWVFPREANTGKRFKRADAMRILADTAATERSAFMAGMNRAEDRKIIMPAFFGPARTGKGGINITNFPSDGSQDVVSTVGSADNATPCGVNTAKLIKARTILSLGDVDMDTDQLVVAMNGTDLESLLSDIKVTNRDYNGGDPVLKNGRLSYWMGFNFVEMNGIPLNPADPTERWLPMWAKSGMHLGVWEEIQTFDGPDPRKKFNHWLYMEQLKGATRLEEKKVVRIKVKATNP